jgi:hypothetical protein
MSDLGELRISDIYRGIASKSVPTISETKLSKDDNDLGTYYDGQTTKKVNGKDKNRIMTGLLALVGLIFILGVMK